MFLPAYAVAPLADFIASYLAGCLDADNNLTEESEMDPNDFIILHDFILPELQDGRSSGVETDDLLDKGWMLALGLLPVLLRRNDLPANAHGALMRAFQVGMLNYALDYIGCLEDDWYRENQDSVNQRIQYALLASPQNKTP